MKLLGYGPETPISETLQWATDVQVTDNGSEVRVSLRDEPKRTLALKYVFSDEDEYRDARTVALSSFDRPFLLPYWHQATRLTADAASGAVGLALAPGRTELRAGSRAVLYARGTAPVVVTILSVDAAGVTLTAPLAGAWRAGASIAPVWPVTVGANVSAGRASGNRAAYLGFAAADFEVIAPFLNPKNETVLSTFSGLPLIDRNSIGDSFDETYVNGSEITDYGGLPNIRVPWSHQQVSMNRVFLCNRYGPSRAEWDMWNAFFDYCRGSQNPFYLPTFRQDFGFGSDTATQVNTVLVKGTSYAEDFFPNEAFRAFKFEAVDGTISFSEAQSVEIVGTNSLVHLSPDIPNKPHRSFSLLLKVRISDDKVTCEHTAIQSRISMNLRTVDN